MGRREILAGATALLVTTAFTSESRAADCVLTPGKTVVLAGSTAIAPLMQQAASALSMATPPIDIVYVNAGSCTGTAAFVTGQVVAGVGTVTHYDSAGVGTTCTLPAGSKADMGVSDVFYDICPQAGGTGLPAGFKNVSGPVQAMVFAVPRMSSQKTLVAEEGYIAFGFGTAGYMGGHVAPWADETKFAIRNDGSGTQQMTARGVGLPNGTVMKGMNSGSTGGVITALTSANASAVTAEPAIGILGALDYDKNRTVLKSLYFQGLTQLHAFLPDSTENAYDKRNVRDGRYAVWGPSHLIVAAGGDGKATNPLVQSLVDYITLAQPLPVGSMLDISIAAGVVPQCAMKAQRISEMGDIMPYAPEKPCGCHMDAKVPMGNTTCTACTDDTMCGGKKCSFGYCE